MPKLYVVAIKIFSTLWTILMENLKKNYLFLQRNSAKQPVPLAVASGGGGLGLGKFIDNGMQHGQAINMSKTPVTGKMYGVQ